MFVFLWFLINKYIRNQINHMAELEKEVKIIECVFFMTGQILYLNNCF
jgi:hypothetical protein